MSTIRLGYEIGTGKPIDIPGDRHIAVSGQTQLSGKTTTLEALVKRSGKCAVAFVTKRGEGGFRTGREIPPYFHDRADWQFVKGLLESQSKTRMNFEASWIIDACRTARTLADVQANIRERLEGKGHYTEKGRGKKTSRVWVWDRRPASGLDLSICTVLNAYLDIVLPQIEKLPYTQALELEPGVNVMHLDGYTPELQALVIRSVIEWVHSHEKNTVVIIPEAWKFVPQKRGSPVLLAAETLIREGAALRNFIWLDSQNISGISTDLRAQIGVWILGVQTEAHEVKRNLGITEISLTRPRERDIMHLKRGEFFVCFGQEMHKVYVQPAWIDSEAHAAAIARGEEPAESVERIWREQKHEKRSGRAGLKEKWEAQQAAEAAAVSVGHSEHGRGFSRSIAAAGAVAPDPREVIPPPPEFIETLHRVANSKSISEDEDRMYKEKFEDSQRTIAKLTREIGELRLQLAHFTPDVPPAAAAPANAASANGIPADFDFAAFLRELRAHPEVIGLLRETPTIEVTIERPRVNYDGNSSNGRIARLLEEGFFKTPRQLDAITSEFRRRGWMRETGRPSDLNQPLRTLNEMGFLFRESEGFVAAPGMKVKAAAAR
ncbi:MAG TPA: hypothetical protein VG345_16525 [Bryobacteraceae bacterium]|nr:hypothetical protein [Bryobacteraceae bacterium]